MKRHAAIENAQSRGGIGEVIAWVVKQHITQSPSDDDSENQPGDEIIQVGFAKGGAFLRPERGPAQGAAHDPGGQ